MDSFANTFKHSFSTTMGKVAGCCGCLFLVVIVGIIIAAASSNSKTSTNPTSVPAKADNTTTTAQATTKATASATQAVPQTLLDLSGSGTKTTQKFTAAGDWDLNWSYDCTNFGSTGNFQVFIYKGDGTASLDNAAVNQLGAKGTDVEHYHTGGTYYLTVNSECSWHITAKG